MSGELSGHLKPLLIGPVCLVSHGRFEEPSLPLNSNQQYTFFQYGYLFILYS